MRITISRSRRLQPHQRVVRGQEQVELRLPRLSPCARPVCEVGHQVVDRGGFWTERGRGPPPGRQHAARGGRVGDALRVGVAGGQGERKRGRLAAGGPAGCGGVLVDQPGAAVDDPDVADIARIDRQAGRAGRDAPPGQPRPKQRPRPLYSLPISATSMPRRAGSGSRPRTCNPWNQRKARRRPRRPCWPTWRRR